MTSIVLQEETTGCGFACVAMVAGKTYSEIKSLANAQGMFAEDEALSATTDYVRKLIGDLGIPLQPSEEKFRDWQSLPPLALLATKYRIENGTPSWHWCVYRSDPATVLDPAAYLEINERRDFENISVQWYIACG